MSSLFLSFPPDQMSVLSRSPPPTRTSHMEMPRLSQGGHIPPCTKYQGCHKSCHKVVTRLSNGYTRLLHHAWLQLTITTSTCWTKAMLVYVLHSYLDYIQMVVRAVFKGGGGGGGGFASLTSFSPPPPLPYISYTIELDTPNSPPC